MFCPECGEEFRPGFTTCADCHVPLVESLDGDAPEEEVAAASRVLEPLHATREPEELGALTELLEEARIPYVLQAGTGMSLVSGEDLHDAEPDYWEARIAVHGPRLGEAKQLLAALRAQRRTS